LIEEALPNNPRVSVDAEGKLSYKPPYNLKNRPALQALLKKNYQEKRGGVSLSDLNDSIPLAEQNVKKTSDVIDIPTARKEHIYFYDDPEMQYGPVDEEFLRLWKSVSVEHLSEKAVEEYLSSKKISYAKGPMQAAPGASAMAQKQRRGRRTAQPKLHNVHLEGILEDYEMD